MIGAAAWGKFLRGEYADLDLTADPRLSLGPGVFRRGGSMREATEVTTQ